MALSVEAGPPLLDRVQGHPSDVIDLVYGAIQHLQADPSLLAGNSISVATAAEQAEMLRGDLPNPQCVVVEGGMLVVDKSPMPVLRFVLDLEPRSLVQIRADGRCMVVDAKKGVIKTVWVTNSLGHLATKEPSIWGLLAAADKVVHHALPNPDETL
jgi:hypothetical protein